ncbi:MAG: hypothetical protein WC797_01025 [Candidatus Paceibacterota bacterium]|jgi:hypothetical protein
MDEAIHNHEKHGHVRVKIAFSGSADTAFLKDSESLKVCEELGAEIVRQGAVLVTGATTGTPLWVAKGAKDAGGVSVGLSPAGSEKEHVELYGLPLEYMDFIMYTGFGFVGRDMLMTRTSDAVLIGPGRIGTIHEFAVAFEDRKPIGILEGDTWETDEVLKIIIEKSHRAQDNPNIVYDKDPKKLVEKVLAMVAKNKEQDYKIYRMSDKFNYECKKDGEDGNDPKKHVVL